MVFRPIPAGRFLMGSRGGKYSDEEPRHWVEITRPFWMGETPVTQDLYASFNLQLADQFYHPSFRR